MIAEHLFQEISNLITGNNSIPVAWKYKAEVLYVIDDIRGLSLMLELVESLIELKTSE